jgi:hypothetical protein
MKARFSSDDLSDVKFKNYAIISYNLNMKDQGNLNCIFIFSGTLYDWSLQQSKYVIFLVDHPLSFTIALIFSSSVFTISPKTRHSSSQTEEMGLILSLLIFLVFS